jgi:hypothetical protein
MHHNMSDQDKILEALRGSRLYDLPRELLVMLIENITKLNRDAFMQELVPLGVGYAPRATLESGDYLRNLYACECFNIQECSEGPYKTCNECGDVVCYTCSLHCTLCSQYADYCNKCVKTFDEFGRLCREHAIENVRRE